MHSRCHLDTPLGLMLAASDGQNLIGLWFQDQKYYPRHWPQWEEAPDLPLFEALRQHLAAYFAGEPGPAMPLAPQGTPFQQEVWQLLLAIPPGATTTYGALAAQIAARRGIPRFSAQAVGSAVGHNPISLLIPCHRVIGADGSLTGYAGGLWRKEALLALENRRNCGD